MKYLIFNLVVVFLCSSCGSDNRSHSSPQQDTVLYYPYSPVYASAFDKGDPVLGKKVLEFWKELETGNIQKRRDLFTDTVEFILPDMIIKGTPDTVLKLVDRKRKAYADVQYYIDSWMTVKTKETAEQLVFVWGRQDGTTKKGERIYSVIHQTWWFTGNGKIRRMTEYLTHPH